MDTAIKLEEKRAKLGTVKFYHSLKTTPVVFENDIASITMKGKDFVIDAYITEEDELVIEESTIELTEKQKSAIKKTLVSYVNELLEDEYEEERQQKEFEESFKGDYYEFN